MIKKLLFISLLCFSLSATDHIPEDAAQITKQVFGTTGVNLSLVSLHFVEDLLDRIATSTLYEQQCACKKAVAILNQEIETRETFLTSADTETKQRIEHNLTIFIIQRDHYERVARLLKKEITTTQKVVGWIKNTAARFFCFILSPYKKYTPPTQKLTNDLVMYTEIERNEILTDHKKTLRLLVCQNKYNVPLIIRFWDYPRHRQRLLNGVKKFQSSAQPQALTAVSEAVEAAGNAIKNEIKTIGEDAGVAIGNPGVTNTLREVGASFVRAFRNLFAASKASLEVGADGASAETAQEVADGLATPGVNKLPSVEDSNVANGEATDALGKNPLEKTGKQTINEFGKPLGEIENLQKALADAQQIESEAAQEVARTTQEALKAAQEAKEAAQAAQEAAQAAEKATADVEKATADAKEATEFADKQWNAVNVEQPSTLEAAKAASEAKLAALKAVKEAEKAAEEARKAAQEAAEEAKITAQLAAEKATTAQIAQEVLGKAQTAVKNAQSALNQAIALQTTEQITNETAEDTSNATTKVTKKAEAAAKQKAAEAKAKEAAKVAKAAEKEARAAEKAAAQAEKKAAAAAKKAQDAERAAEAADKKAEQALQDAQKKRALAEKNPTQENKDAADKADAALEKAKAEKAAASKADQAAQDEADQAATEAEKTADTAKPLRTAADEAKEAAKKAAAEAFGPVKTWAEQGKEFVEMMGNLVLQMEICMGAQMVAAWQSAADALTFARLSQERTALMTHLNHFFSQLAVQQTNALAKINANFSAQIAVIASQLCLQTTSTGTVVLSGLLPALFAVEQSFITQALVTATVKSVFLLNPMPDDQLFYESAMAVQTTISSHLPFASNGLSNTWYNPYRSGNWQFCSVDYSGTIQGPVTSFVQYGSQPFTSSIFPQGDPTLAVQNSIFTEYIPPAQYNTQSIESYTISVACTLLSEPYEPFMMGVMFNGARWISGVLDLHHQHRLFCIYSLPGQKPGTYNVGFAETFYQNQGLMNQTQDQLSDQNIAGLNAIWPAYQLLSPDINKLAALAKSSAATPVTNPLATIPALPIGTPYIFTIETQPNQVILTISTAEGKILYPAGQTEASLQNELSLPNKIQNLNGLTFLYHNIGFTAPGCSAQFCLKKPEALCFSESQIKTIHASLNKGMS